MRNAKAILCESVLIAAAGFVLALAANAISPRGLQLARNYFPGSQEVVPPPAPRTAPTASAAMPPTNAAAPTPSAAAVPAAAEATLRRLEQHGLQSAGSNDVIALFRDPRYEQGLIAFVDARDDSHYQEGHIPGAWQFYHYRAEAFLPTVLPVCMGAQKVVVYCTGGQCEDSEFAAIMLRDAGVPRTSLSVYVGGITEWKNNGMPLETGGRRSGQLLNTAKP